MITVGSRVKWERPGLPPALGTVTDSTTDSLGNRYHKVTDDRANRFIFHEDVVTEA
jgi:hypothetical protein